MSNKMTREELYDLMWSKTATEIAKEFGVSGTAIAKICQRYDIPRPPMGHWNKVKAGKSVHHRPLIQRSPGMSDEITIGGGRYSYGYGRTSDEELATSNPEQPVFEDEMGNVRSRVKKLIKKIQVENNLERPHRLLRHYIEEDEERLQKFMKSGSSWDAPLFDDPIEQRRLKIISALFTATEQNGFKPYISGKEARSLGIKVHDQEMPFSLDATSQSPNHWGEISIRTRGGSSKLILSLGSQHQTLEPKVTWEDHGQSLVENKLREILIEIIVLAEQHYRDRCQHRYEWAVEAKAEAIESIRKKKEEEERLERERIIQLEQARVDRLLHGAAALKQANEIREYVRSVSERYTADPDITSPKHFEAWANWAHAQADRIDPVVGGLFLDAMVDGASP